MNGRNGQFIGLAQGARDIVTRGLQAVSELKEHARRKAISDGDYAKRLGEFGLQIGAAAGQSTRGALGPYRLGR